MTMPESLSGQVKHVFPAGAQRDVLVRLAERVESLAVNECSPQVVATGSICEPVVNNPKSLATFSVEKDDQLGAESGE